MKVLHLVAGDLSGGAARGAYWLHLAQRQIGIDSRVLISGYSDADDPSVISLATSRLQKLKLTLLAKIDAVLVRCYPRRMRRIFSTGFAGVNFTNSREYREADVLHLHWINGMVNMRTLSRINKPVVWTLRDMWPLTGGCHYTMGCERYLTGCGRCPQLSSQQLRDLSHWVSARKRLFLPKNLKVVGISKWLSECAAQSSVFKGVEIRTITNTVDTTSFYPENPKEARQTLGLPMQKKIVLIGAQHISDFYKGFDLFLAALHGMDTSNLHVVLFGKVSKDALAMLNVEHTNLGFISDTAILRRVYSAADVFVAPSRMDAFGKTLAEAMACGTPVACFNATGTQDVVEHMATGYKARAFEAEDLRAGILWLVHRPIVEMAILRRQSHERVMKYFAPVAVAKQYEALYKEILS